MVRAVCIVFCVLFGLAYAQEALQPASLPQDIGPFAANKIHVLYSPDSIAPIPIEELEALNVTVGLHDLGYVAPQSHLETISTPLSQIGAEFDQYYGSALLSIAKEIVNHFNKRGYVGIFVAIDPKQIHPSGADLRHDKEKSLNLVVSTCRIASIKTVAAGPYVVGKCPINHRVHARIRESCPLVCDPDGLSDDPNALLNCKVINDWVYRLNRYPTRIINAEVDGIPDIGAVDLSLVINEERPWHFYLNAANVGTATTGKILERLGYVNYQLTHHDDTLAIEYATIAFRRMHSVWGYYEAPVYKTERLRLRVDGSFSNFDVIALEILGYRFRGKQWRVGPTLIANVYQYNDFFIDLSLGMFWFHVQSINEILQTDAHNRFLLPTVGLVLDWRRPLQTVYFTASLQKNLDHLAPTKVSTLSQLGRMNVNSTWQLLQFNLIASSYLKMSEGDIHKQRPHSPHEVALIAGGQYAFSARLIPQLEGVIGGLYTVRGYPQSCATGDNVYFAQFEYRYHQLFYTGRKEDCCSSFCKNSQLLYRLFLDSGRTAINHILSGEASSTLLGLGGGLEYTFKRNVVLRYDLGMALLDNPVSGTKRGTCQSYFSATLLF